MTVKSYVSDHETATLASLLISFIIILILQHDYKLKIKIKNNNMKNRIHRKMDLKTNKIHV